MRLRRLELTRYGCFTDHNIDFGEPIFGAPDIHIIYGENEAGKSTIFEAYLDLLFGIGPQTPYNFKHPYDTMLIGATLEQNGVRKAFKRVKKQSSLLDEQGLPLSEGALGVFLAGLGRQQCLAMFSLNDESIKKGGDDILASKGETGALLFAASAGLAQFNDKLKGLSEEADQFHKKGGRKIHIRMLKDELQKHKDAKVKLDVQASQYETLRKERDAAKRNYEEAVDKRRSLHDARVRAERLLRALPLDRALSELDTRLVPLASLPEPDPSWHERAPELNAQLARLDAQRIELDKRHDKILQQLEIVADDPVGLAVAGELVTLGNLMARFSTADEDLPARRQERSEIARAIQSSLAALGQQHMDQPEQLLLPQHVVHALGRLNATSSGVRETLKAASRAARDAKDRFAAEEARFTSTENVDDDAQIDALVRLVETIGAQKIGERLLSARMSAAERQAASEEALARLAPWQGALDGLKSLEVPSPDTIRAWIVRHGNAEAELARLLSDIEKLKDKCNEFRSARDAIHQTETHVPDAELAELRGRREAAWRQHRLSLTETTAEAFEMPLRLHDVAMERRILQQTSQARWEQVLRAVLETEEAMKGALEKRSHVENDIRLLDGQYASWIAVATFPVGYMPTPGEFEAWARLRQDAIVASDFARRSQNALDETREEVLLASKRLSLALGRTDGSDTEQADFDELIAKAHKVTNQQQQMRDQRKRQTQLSDEATKFAREEAEARRGLDDWTAQWQQTLAGTWMSTAALEPDVVGPILDQLSELRAQLNSRASLDDRILKMEQDQKDFRVALDGIYARHGLESKASNPILSLQYLQGRANSAQNKKEQRDKLSVALQEWKTDRSEFDQEDALCRQAVEEIRSLFYVETLSQAISCLEQILDRNRLREELSEKRTALLREMQSTEFDVCRQILAALSEVELQSELAELSEQHEAADKACQELFAATSAAETKLNSIGGDDEAARLDQQIRMQCLEIEEKAIDYVRLRAGVLAASRALSRYREYHQSSMMQAASEAFTQITNDRYVRLQSQPAGSTEELVAVERDGGSKVANQLSKGTSFQLYLALRAAGYREYATTRPTLPFIADDILETFDNPRSSRTFEVLAEMAKFGQVVYLTHHGHLRDMAVKLIPSVRVHELPTTG